LNRGLDDRNAAQRVRFHGEVQSGPVAAKCEASRSDQNWRIGCGRAALGAFAVGALAVGSLAIGALAIYRARIKRLEIDELVIRRLRRGGPADK
jgi:hypothetical protein